MNAVKEQFERDFICPKCRGRGACVQDVTLGKGRVVLPLAPGRFLAVSCALCGYTEFYNATIAERACETETVTVPDASAASVAS